MKKNLSAKVTPMTAGWFLPSAEGNRVTSRIFHGKIVTRQPSDVLASLKRLQQERA
jgi:hypothetical protein